MRKVEDELQARGAATREPRRAHFVSVLALALPGGEAETFEGRVDGTLVWPPRGHQGFGYDPMFQPDGHTRTFGEMSAEEKHGWRPGKAEALSHRARAFKRFAEQCLGT
jgi:XTP/dITP diphosphohydrolase